jgi:hypothetical protein
LSALIEEKKHAMAIEAAAPGLGSRLYCWRALAR